MAAERPSKRACHDAFLFTSESVGEGHPGKQGSDRSPCAYAVDGRNRSCMRTHVGRPIVV